MGREFGGGQGTELLYHHHQKSPMLTTGEGYVLEELGQPKMPWNRWRLEKGEQQLPSCGGSTALGSPAIDKGGVQQQLTSYGGRITVGTLAVCSRRGYFKSHGAAVRTPR